MTDNECQFYAGRGEQERGDDGMFVWVGVVMMATLMWISVLCVNVFAAASRHVSGLVNLSAGS